MATNRASNDWNVLLITSDEHNPKIMGCAGDSTVQTPTMDRLAREGTLFTKAYCPYPACAPTRQSMITGRYPQEHGQIGNPYYFDERNRTWAHYFHDCGYTTACIGKMHTNNEWHDHGYDFRLGPLDYDAVIQSHTAAWRDSARHTDGYTGKVFGAFTPQLCREMFQAEVVDTPQEHRDVYFLEQTKRYLREHKDQKFFLHASFNDPHWPWNVPEPFFSMYDPAAIHWPELIPGDLNDDWLANKLYHSEHWDRLPEDIIRLCRSKYYASTSYLDHTIGQIIDLLDDLDLAQNTLVVYCSDHGDMAGEKGLWFKDLMFDATTRVPLIARMPGVIPAGRRCEELISLVDLFPTFASLVGADAPLPENISGTDLSAAFRGGDCHKQYAYCVYQIDPSTLRPRSFMIRSPRWKCIRYDMAEEKDRYVLYDMDNDPDEVHNLAHTPAYQEILDQHLSEMERFLAKCTPSAFNSRIMLQIG